MSNGHLIRDRCKEGFHLSKRWCWLKSPLREVKAVQSSSCHEDLNQRSHIWENRRGKQIISHSQLRCKVRSAQKTGNTCGRIMVRSGRYFAGKQHLAFYGTARGNLVLEGTIQHYNQLCVREPQKNKLISCKEKCLPGNVLSNWKRPAISLIVVCYNCFTRGVKEKKEDTDSAWSTN